MIKHTLKDSNLSKKELEEYLKSQNLKAEDIMILTHSTDGFGEIVRKDTK